jgi:hypothetical protein
MPFKFEMLTITCHRLSRSKNKIRCCDLHVLRYVTELIPLFNIYPTSSSRMILELTVFDMMLGKQPQTKLSVLASKPIFVE